jgi:hypothetical protein
MVLEVSACRPGKKLREFSRFPDLTARTFLPIRLDLGCGRSSSRTSSYDRARHPIVALD